MKTFTKKELQDIFGPKVIAMTERRSHFGMAPCLVIEKGITLEQRREIEQKFKNWKHQVFIESVGCKTDEEWHKKIFGKV